MDISLSDVFWVGGSLIAFVIVMSLVPYARPAAQVVGAIWRQAQESGLIRINIVRDYEDDEGTGEGAGVSGRGPATASQVVPPARTGADARTALTQGALSAQGASAPENTPLVAFRTHQDQQAARRMIKHKIANPSADMLDTIRAGFPEIKSRSGDPRSKYQLYGKPMYHALFSEPEPTYPALEAQRRPSVVTAQSVEPPPVRSTFRESDPELAYQPPE